jgi:hypothetical protein
LRINSYEKFIDSFMRNVNEGKSDDLRKAWSILMAISPASFSGRLRHKCDIEEARGFSSSFQLQLFTNPRERKIDERATRPMLRTAFNLAVPMRIGAACPARRDDGHEQLAHCGGSPERKPAICGEKDTSSRQPQLNGQRDAEVSSPIEACIICMLCVRSIRTGPVVLHRAMT